MKSFSTKCKHTVPGKVFNMKYTSTYCIESIEIQLVSIVIKQGSR